jgi:hypothetical protein
MEPLSYLPSDHCRRRPGFVYWGTEDTSCEAASDVGEECHVGLLQHERNGAARRNAWIFDAALDSGVRRREYYQCSNHACSNRYFGFEDRREPSEGRHPLGAGGTSCQRPLSGSLDGVLGPETKRALIQFQQKNGLAQTASVDAQTWDALTGSSGIGEGSCGMPSDANRFGSMTHSSTRAIWVGVPHRNPTRRPPPSMGHLAPGSGGLQSTCLMP